MKHEQTPREPTAEECSANALVFEDPKNDRVGYAVWYPQMGGYAGKAVVVFSSIADSNRTKGDQCFDVYVWHDGDWPFHDGEDAECLHHCRASQFIQFGITVRNMMRGKEKPWRKKGEPRGDELLQRKERDDDE